MLRDPPFVRSPYNYDVEAASEEAAIPAEVWASSPSMTVQSMAEDCDLNVLMARFGVTGKMPENPRVPVYGDFTHITDFRSALHAVQAAQDDFMELPANVRARFDNNPQLLLEFVENAANRDEAAKLGLLKPVAPPIGGPPGGEPAQPAPAPAVT